MNLCNSSLPATDRIADGQAGPGEGGADGGLGRLSRGQPQRRDRPREVPRAEPGLCGRLAGDDWRSGTDELLDQGWWMFGGFCLVSDG